LTETAAAQMTPEAAASGAINWSVTSRDARNLPLSSQILPNKSKQNGLDLLGFIRQNRDFSMGYGESK